MRFRTILCFKALIQSKMVLRIEAAFHLNAVGQMLDQRGVVRNRDQLAVKGNVLLPYRPDALVLCADFPRNLNLPGDVLNAFRREQVEITLQ